MLRFLKTLFSGGKSTDFLKLLENGAQIIDVRSRGEFLSGHIKGSVNIPLQQLNEQIHQLKKDKPIITCCASGMRSASAKTVLKANGFQEVYNGGGWMSLQRKLTSS